MATLELTTMIGCPLKCTYCPQDELGDAYAKAAAKYMQLDDLGRMLDKLPRHVFISFSGMSEPWSNPAATDMLALTLEHGFSINIYSTLHGMSVADADRVVALLRRYDEQFEALCLHLPDANGNMRGWRYSDEYDSVLARILTLRGLGASYRRRVTAMTMDRWGHMHATLAHHRVRPKQKRWQGHSWAGNLSTKVVLHADSTHHTGAVNCGYSPFYDQNVVMPNGDVYLCCMDYSLKHRLGNLLEQDYTELALSRELAVVRSVNAQPGFSNRSLCKSCTAGTSYECRGSEWSADVQPSLRESLGQIASGLACAVSRRLLILGTRRD